MGGPVARGQRACRYTVIAHGSELEYSMRGNAELSAWGGETLAGARRRDRRLRAHPRGARPRSSARWTTCTRCPPGSTSSCGCRSRGEQALAGAAGGGPRDPPNPGNATSGSPTRATRSGWTTFLAGDEPTVVYFGKLIENKGVQVLLDALREVDARAVIVGFGPDRPTVRAAGGGHARALHRAVRAPAPGAPAGVRRRRRGAVDLPRGVRHGRRRGRGGRLPADRRPPLRAGRGGGRAGAGLPGRHGAAGGLPERGQRRAGGADRRGAVAVRTTAAPSCASAARRAVRRAVELVERRASGSSRRASPE